jgi:hypothetical protein
MKDRYFLPNGRSYPDTIGRPTSSVADWTGGVSGTPCSAGATIPNAYPPNPSPCTHAISTTDSDTHARPSRPALFLYTPQLDHLSNDAENFGGLVTEIIVPPVGEQP